MTKNMAGFSFQALKFITWELARDTTVLDMVTAFEKASEESSSHKIPLVMAVRRPSDAEIVYALTDKAKRELNWNKLVNLKYLYREKCYELRCMPVGVGKLTRLRVLTDFVVEDESIAGMQHVGQLKDLKALSVNLKTRLSIQFHINFTGSAGYDWEGSCLEGAEDLKEVEIGFSFPSHILCQRRMDEENGVKEEAVMTKLQPHPNLRMFMLSHYAGSKITSWGRAQDNWAEARYLPNLVHIKLSNCHRLQQLPLLSKLLHLKSLYLFELKNLKFVEEPVITGRESGRPFEGYLMFSTF